MVTFDPNNPAQSIAALVAEIESIQTQFETEAPVLNQLIQLSPPTALDWGAGLALSDQLVWYEPATNQLGGSYVFIEGQIQPRRGNAAPGIVDRQLFRLYDVTDSGLQQHWLFELKRVGKFIIHFFGHITANSSFDFTVTAHAGPDEATPANAIYTGVSPVFSRTYLQRSQGYDSNFYLPIPSPEGVEAGWYGLRDGSEIAQQTPVTSGSNPDVTPYLTFVEIFYDN